MMFTLSSEQTDFALVLHSFLEAGRRDLAELGVEEVTDPVDLVVVFEELGHHAVPGPLIESLAVVPALLGEAGAEAGSHAVAVAPSSAVPSSTVPSSATPSPAAPPSALPTSAAPSAAAPSSAAPTSAAPPSAVPSRSRGATSSVAFLPQMPHALEADRYLLVDGDTVHEALPVVSVSSVDPSRTLFELAPGPVVATGVPATRAFDLGVLVCAAQLLGLGRAMLEMTTAHALARTQFGKPIGSFQAVKHHLANALIGLELARPLIFGAAVTMTSRDVSAAKVATADAAWAAARTALQVHGAIGYTAEHDLGRFLLQTRALRTAWGSPSMHRTRVLEAL
ncbi:acyl-CoA dehydrogenase family protein [Lentzea sp. NPDC051213]|uniref:acyl-CoA dehydrogenase family protein n=1 Tax=Lentzea sp. NPDC051213 TaxID=3364126 RepID=UPI0037B091DD